MVSFCSIHTKSFAQEQQATTGEVSVLGKKEKKEQVHSKVNLVNLDVNLLKKGTTDKKKQEKLTQKNIFEKNILAKENIEKNNTLEKNEKSNTNLNHTLKHTLKQKQEFKAHKEEYTKKNLKTSKQPKNQYQKYAKKKQKKQWFFKFRPFLDLNWLLVGICLVLFLGLVIGLWFLLFAITSLSLIQAILVALSFALALWCFFLLRTESDMQMALYDYFVRFGLFTFFMWALLWVGLAGLFGIQVAFTSAITVGLLLGLVGFLVSLFLRKTFLHHRW